MGTRFWIGGGALGMRSSTVQFDADPALSTHVVSPTTATTQEIRTQEKVIEDMCSAIQQQEPYMGFLEIEDAKLLFHQDLDAGTPPPKVETLDEFMEATPRRDARLKLGLSITWNILKLGPSWIPESWHKSSLVLLRTSELLPNPYISHQSIHKILKSPSTPEASRARASLLTLGILLLELLFHDTLENQPFRANYLNGHGKPNNMTDFCTAMEWQKKVEAEFGDRLADAIVVVRGRSALCRPGFWQAEICGGRHGLDQTCTRDRRARSDSEQDTSTSQF
jgi:hypothetical protein